MAQRSAVRIGTNLTSDDRAQLTRWATLRELDVYFASDYEYFPELAELRLSETAPRARSADVRGATLRGENLTGENERVIMMAYRDRTTGDAVVASREWFERGRDADMTCALIAAFRMPLSVSERAPPAPETIPPLSYHDL